jgi:hypothetical protein
MTVDRCLEVLKNTRDWLHGPEAEFARSTGKVKGQILQQSLQF